MSTQIAEATRPKVVNTLNTCIETCIDGLRGYAAAAADVRDAGLKTIFDKYSAERAEFVRVLRRSVREYGDYPTDHGTAKGAAHRAFISTRVALETNKDAVLLDECERGELAAIAAYDRAFTKTPANTLPKEVRSLLVAQRTAIQTAYDEITAEDLGRRRASH